MSQHFGQNLVSSSVPWGTLGGNLYQSSVLVSDGGLLRSTQPTRCGNMIFMRGNILVKDSHLPIIYFALKNIWIGCPCFHITSGGFYHPLKFSSWTKTHFICKWRHQKYSIMTVLYFHNSILLYMKENLTTRFFGFSFGKWKRFLKVSLAYNLLDR